MKFTDVLGKHLHPTEDQCRKQARAGEFFEKARRFLDIVVGSIEKQIPGFRLLLMEILNEDCFKMETSFPKSLGSDPYGLPGILDLSVSHEGRIKQYSVMRGKLSVVFKATEELPEIKITLTGGSSEDYEDEQGSLIETGDIKLEIEQKWTEKNRQFERRHAIKLTNLRIHPDDMQVVQGEVDQQVHDFFAGMNIPDIVFQLRRAVRNASEVAQEARGEDIFSWLAKQSTGKLPQ